MKKIIGFYRKCDLLTMTGTLSSFVGMILAINSHFTLAAFCMLICGICDGFDGKLARSKKYSKEQKIYGVQLDSLSDIICFGVFPAILTSLLCNNIYVYIICAIYMMCAVIRLAYFNMLDAMPKSKKGIFIGVPTTTVSIIYPIILFVVRFINYNALKIVMPIMLILLGLSFILRIEIKKIDVAALLNKIFNKYVVTFIVFPMFVVIASDLFFKINGFDGRSYVDMFISIFHHFLPFLFITGLVSLLMLLLTAIFKTSKRAKIIILILMIIFLFVNDAKFSMMGLPIQLSDVYYLNPDNIAMMGAATASFGLWIFRVILKCIVLSFLAFILIKLDKLHSLKIENKKSRIISILVSLIILVIPFMFFNKINKVLMTGIYRLETEEVLSISDTADMYYDYGFYQGMYLDNLGKQFLTPGSYSKANARVALEKSTKEYKKGTWGKANVVFILSESFADPQNLSEVQFDRELMPNIKSYEKDDDKIVMDLLVSPIGGTSVNSEFEVLTGASLAFFQNEFIPYTQYYEDEHKGYTQSLINEFNNNGYKTMYLSPWGQTSYKSEYIYNLFGVDKTIYGDRLFGEKKGEYYSDEALMNDIYNELKNTSKNNYKFIMSATAQNHFPFSVDKYSKKELDIKIKKSNLSKEDTAMFRSYGQGIYDADKALNQIYQSIQKLDTPTIIVFFGDHLPYIVNSFGDNIYLNASYYNTENEDINEIRKHTTKAVILSNYKIDTDDLDYINSSYLGAYVLNKLDLEISDYFKFIDYTRTLMPTFNRKGIYNAKDNKFTSLKDINANQKTVLNNYKYVQYYKFYDYEK